MRLVALTSSRCVSPLSRPSPKASEAQQQRLQAELLDAQQKAAAVEQRLSDALSDATNEKQATAAGLRLLQVRILDARRGSKC